MSGTFLTANVYVGNRHVGADLELLTRLRCDVVGLQEAHRIRDRLDRLPGYRVAGSAVGNGPAEVPLLIRAGLTWRGEGIERMTRNMGTPIAPDRWATWARVGHPGLGRLLVVCTHANAAIIDKATGRPHDAPRVEQYLRHMRRLAALIRYHRAAGWQPVVMLDANVPGDSRWRYAPGPLFGRLGLNYVPHRIDGIAYDRTAFRCVARQEVTPTGADHVWLKVTLARQDREVGA